MSTPENHAAVPRAFDVLVVDDDEDIRSTCVEVLGLEGFVTEAAADGQMALDRLAEGPVPRLILLDVTMPRMNGIQFIEKQKQDPSIADIPVVVISAAGKLIDRISPMDVRGLLRKPFALDDLISTARRWCAT